MGEITFWMGTTRWVLGGRRGGKVEQWQWVRQKDWGAVGAAYCMWLLAAALEKVFLRSSKALQSSALWCNLVGILLSFTVPHTFPWSPCGLLMDPSWTLHNLLKSHDNPFKVLWSPWGVPMESSWSPQWSPRGVLMESSWSPCGVPMESSSSSVWSEFNGDVGFVIRVTICGKSGKHKCDRSLGTIFQCEFNGDVGFIIRVTIYGKSSKHTSVIHLQEPFINMN